MKKVVLLTNILTPYRRAFYDEMRRVALKRKMDFSVLVMSNTEEGRRWEYHDFSTDYTTLLNKKTLLGDKDSLYFCTDLVEKLKEKRPDLLILAGSYTLFPVWQALIWAKKEKIRLFFWSESHLDEERAYNKIKYFVREKIRKLFYSSMDGFWYPGEKARKLIDCYAKEDVFFIRVPNLIDNKTFEKNYSSINMSKEEICRKYNLNYKKRRLFSAMRLIPVKGIMPFLEEWALTEDKDKIQWIIAGEGELREEIQQYACNKELDVRLLGYCNEKEITELLYACDCFVLPSKSDANPLSCIEALWCQKPLFVSEHVGNYPETIEEGKNGYVFYDSIQGDLKRKIENLLACEKQWFENAGRNSAMIAQNKFEMTTNVNRIVLSMLEYMNGQY